jgi:hypothetical protein
MTIPELEGWLTIPAAAQRLGMTRQGLHLAVNRGELRSVHRIGRLLILSEAEITQVAQRRQPRHPALPVSLPQAKALVAIFADRNPRGFRGPYPGPRTSRSLRRKGLIDDHWHLTDEGIVAARLCMQHAQGPTSLPEQQAAGL